MQIILASAKIMNEKFLDKPSGQADRKSVPDINLSSPRFQNEAESFARDMARIYGKYFMSLLDLKLTI